jgi:hypothetical protein
MCKMLINMYRQTICPPVASKMYFSVFCLIFFKFVYGNFKIAQIFSFFLNFVLSIY